MHRVQKFGNCSCLFFKQCFWSQLPNFCCVHVNKEEWQTLQTKAAPNKTKETTHKIHGQTPLKGFKYNTFFLKLLSLLKTKKGPKQENTIWNISLLGNHCPQYFRAKLKQYIIRGICHSVICYLLDCWLMALRCNNCKQKLSFLCGRHFHRAALTKSFTCAKVHR